MKKVSIVLVVIVIILTGVLFYFSSKSAEYTISDGILNISGMYGEKVIINKISSLDLKETIPKILTKTDGSGLGSMDKGYFKLKDIGEAKLFIDETKPPFIYIKTDSRTIILNCKESKKTKDLYLKLNNIWKSR